MTFSIFLCLFQITERFIVDVKERVARVEEETAKVEAEAKKVAAKHAAMIGAFGNQGRIYKR